MPSTLINSAAKTSTALVLIACSFTPSSSFAQQTEPPANTITKAGAESPIISAVPAIYHEALLLSSEKRNTLISNLLALLVANDTPTSWSKENRSRIFSLCDLIDANNPLSYQLLEQLNSKNNSQPTEADYTELLGALGTQDRAALYYSLWRESSELYHQYSHLIDHQQLALMLMELISDSIEDGDRPQEALYASMLELLIPEKQDDSLDLTDPNSSSGANKAKPEDKPNDANNG